MKKALVTLLLAALALSCLIAGGFAGFYGYRHYLRGGRTQEAPPEGITPSSDTNAPPGPVAATGDSPPSDLPEVYGQTRRSGGPAEAVPAPEPPRTSKDNHSPLETRPSADTTTSERQPPSPPGPAPGGEPAQQGWKLRPGPAAPYAQTRRSGAAAAAETPSPSAPKPPKGGSLGFIFESRVDRGELVFRVDDAPPERVPFQASAENRFRFTREVPLAPGAHRVKVRVNLPGEEPQVREWTVTVAPGGNTVWKATLDRFPMKLEVKNIP